MTKNRSVTAESKGKKLSKEAGLKFRKIRISLNQTLDDVVKNCPNIYKSHLSEWENGLKQMPNWAAVDLAIHYGVSLDFIYGIKQENEISMSIELNEAVHTVASSYMNLMVDKLGGAIGSYAVTMHCFEQTTTLAASLCDEIDKMIAINPDWFEENVRCGAKVVNLIAQSRQSIEKSRYSAKKHRLSTVLSQDKLAEKSINHTLNLAVD